MPWFVTESFSSTLSMLKGLGYSGIDLVLRDPSDAREASVAELLADHDLSLCSVVTGPARKIDGLSLSEPRTARLAIARVQRHIEYASELGAKVILGWMLGQLPDNEDRAASESVLASSLGECSKIAAALGVDVLLEPINRYESNVAARASDALRLNKMSGGGFWLLLDTFHMNIEESDPVRTAREVGAMARHVHLADSNRLVPGKGHFPFTEFLEALESGGFSGTFAVEAMPVPDVYDAAHAAITTWRNWQLG
jgi:sugar phosphate isomerase/epimerase